MKGHNLSPKIVELLILAALAFGSAKTGLAQGSNIEVWAKNPTNSYPVIFGTSEWVLIGTAFGENFEKDYAGKKSLENLLLKSILQLSSYPAPKVAVFSGGDSSDIMGMKRVMKSFAASKDIASFDQTAVSPYVPLDVSLYDISQYDVVILDPSICKGPDWQFVITQNSQKALARYLENGGRIVASAYLFVYWNAYSSWERMLYNEDLSDLLFDGARPDINAYSATAVTNFPLNSGETIETLNAVTEPAGAKNPLFHYFWKLELSIKKPK